MKPTFSVIIPSYQQGHFIEETIKSVLHQKDISSDDIECLVCDGGSTDQTVEILKKYESHIQWISQPDGGQADAVNKGIQRTQGDVIAWINSDDIYYPDAFSTVKSVFQTHPDFDVVYGNAHWIDEAGNFLAAYPVVSWNYKKLKQECYISQPATFFRRRIVENLGALNTELNYCMDYELWLRYGEHSSFYYVNTLLAGARMYASNKSLGQKLAAYREANDMLLKKIKYVPVTWITSYALVKTEQENSLSKYNHNDLNRLIQLLILNALGLTLKYNPKMFPMILVKSIFWILFPEKIWFKRVEPALKEIGN